MIEFSPSFDRKYYLDLNPELKGCPSSVVMNHYLNYAEKLGKSSCEYDRREGLISFLKKNCKDASILEIGPWDNPSCTGENVEYFDVLDTVKLKERAKLHHRPFNHIPEKIHYVHSEGDLSIIDKKFDIVFSSHVIEHQPDLITHFQRVSRLLQENGLYILCIPDKRYCFDHFLPESTATEIIEAFVRKARFHSFKSLLNSACMVTHNDAIKHWMGDHGGYCFQKAAIDVAKIQCEDNIYHDAHEWQFTPKAFQKNMNVLLELGLVDLSLYRLCHTLYGSIEFVAILRKSPKSEVTSMDIKENNQFVWRMDRESFYIGSLNKNYHALENCIDGWMDRIHIEEEKYLYCCGWTICKNEELARGRKIILIWDGKSKCLAFDIEVKERLDIVNLLHDNQYRWCGFESYLDREHIMSLPGEYIYLFVGYMVNDDVYTSSGLKISKSDIENINLSSIQIQ